MIEDELNKLKTKLKNLKNDIKMKWKFFWSNNDIDYLQKRIAKLEEQKAKQW